METIILILYVLFWLMITLTILWAVFTPGDNIHVVEGYYEPDPYCDACNGTGFLDEEKSISCFCTDKIM